MSKEEKYQIQKRWVARNREHCNEYQRQYYKKKRERAVREGTAKFVRFTEEEKRYIQEHYQTDSSFEIALKLNCSSLKVSRWISTHKLKPLWVHKWTERKARWLIAEYDGNKKTTDEIAQMLGIRASSVRTLVRNLSIKYNIPRNRYGKGTIQRAS